MDGALQRWGMAMGPFPVSDLVGNDVSWLIRKRRYAERPDSDDEVVERCILALVNEGARILDEGIAVRASDIDLVYVTGYGFAPHRGGPMFHADTVGLRNVVRAMERFARNTHADPRFWTPAPLLATLAAEGKSFN